MRLHPTDQWFRLRAKFAETAACLADYEHHELSQYLTRSQSLFACDRILNKNTLLHEFRTSLHAMLRQGESHCSRRKVLQI